MHAVYGDATDDKYTDETQLHTHARTHRRTSLTHTVRQTDGILWWHMSVYRVRIIFCFCTSYKNAEREVLVMQNSQK